MKSNMKSNVIENVVKHDLCIGCGACAALCPQKALVMKFNESGEYNPIIEDNCLEKCDLCLSVCPFNDGNKNETILGKELYGNIENIKYLFETGYYLESYVGYSHNFRQIGASGGMATWLLTTLLQENIVDYVICVTPNNNPDQLFRFEIFEDTDSILKSSGSVYYPVEMSQVIQKILDKSGRYAITGLPCFLKALRLAGHKNKKLRDRISVTIGLTCGQMKSKHYTTYLSTLAKAGGKLQKVCYRGKSCDKPASNFFFYCINEKGSEGKIFWDEGLSEAWGNRWFTPNACNFCDDIFAELADVTVMDAWISEYSHDTRGTSLILVRSPLILSLISDNIRNNQIDINIIPIKKLVKSQEGVIDVKRNQLSYRLHLAEINGFKLYSKRVISTSKIKLVESLEVKIKNNMQIKSRNLFIDNYHDDFFNIESFRHEMQPCLNKLYFLIRLKICGILSTRILNKIKCSFRRN